MTKYTPQQFKNAFWNRVDQSDGEDNCWNWIGARSPEGYGRQKVGKRNTFAHRVAYEICIGEIPEGMVVLQQCHNRLCCNPKHLFLGTNKTAQNSRWDDSVRCEMFWSKVSVNNENGCWEWIGSTDKDGYGKVKWRGQDIRAPRVAWQLTYGEIPDGLWVLHNCPNGDNPTCVNPDHLWLGNVTDNNRDRVAKGRHNPARGECAGGVKLTWEKVRAIRRRYGDGGVTMCELAQEHGVSQSSIRLIIHNKNWRE